MIFEEYKLDPAWNEDDIMDYEYKYKKKLFGNLNFIAFLVKNKMINQKVPYYVFDDLLLKASAGQGDNKVNTFEGACKFLQQIGKTLDKSDRSNLTGKQGEAQEKFEKIIQTLQNVADNPKVDTRTRIIIKNTLELRERGWDSKNDKDGPKTQEQHKKDYHKEQNMKKYESEQSYNEQPQSNKGGQNQRRNTQT